jgi:uncharacterized membrane protein YhhN
MAFLGAAGVSAFWVLGSRAWFPPWHGFPNTASTTLLLLAAAAAAPRTLPAAYRWSIVLGLGFSALGDAFLMQRKDYFIAGLGSFLAAHICYLWAFTRDSRWAAFKLPFLIWGAMGLVMVPALWTGIAGALRIPVLLYAVALLAMAAQAASRAAAKRDAAAVYAAVGAGLFVISDSVLAFQRFRHPLEWGHAIVLGSYFAAQSGIALSVVLRSDRTSHVK